MCGQIGQTARLDHFFIIRVKWGNYKIRQLVHYCTSNSLVLSARFVSFLVFRTLESGMACLVEE